MKIFACIEGLFLSGVCVNLLNKYICMYVQGCVHVIAEVKVVCLLNCFSTYPYRKSGQQAH